MLVLSALGLSGSVCSIPLDVFRSLLELSREIVADVVWHLVMLEWKAELWTFLLSIGVNDAGAEKRP